MQKSKQWDAMYNQTYKAIIKHLKDNKTKINQTVDCEMPEEIAQELEENNIISFSLVSRCSGGNDDFWLQAEYYSKKLNKTIIYDYDFISCYADMIAFADELASTEAYITEFEEKISFNK